MFSDELSLTVTRVTYKAWPFFAPHHYLTSGINRAARCYIVHLDDGTPVAWVSYLPLPHAKLKNAWRGHRTVVLPDYQGLGLGPRISNFIAETVKRDGGRYYSRTTHPRLIAYRDASPLWRVTSRAKPHPKGSSSTMGGWQPDTTRETVSHEYVGHAS